MFKRIVLLATVALALGLAHVAAAGTLGVWAFDDGSGTTARDSSGNGNNGRLVNGPTWADGILGKAIQFDGVDDFVEVPHNAKLVPTTGHATVAVWINAQRHTGPNNVQWQGILAKGGAPRLYNLYTQQNQTLHFSTGPSGGYIGSSSTGTVPLNEWVHIAVVVDNAHLYYLNGEPAGTGGLGATVPTGSTANLTIGTCEADREFLGRIDDVRLYDMALTPEQVKDLYNGNPPSWPKARNPSPADGDPGVLTPLFQWEPGEGALLHDVYLGTSPELTEADRVATGQPIALYWHAPGLQPGITYYWRVDEIKADMVTVTTGDVWSFNAAPHKAYAPSPADGARNVRRDSELTWSPAGGAISHDVYLGSDRDEVAAGTGDTFQGSQPGTTFDPDVLEGDTTYYWRIDEIDVSDNVMTGDIWSFRTLPAIPVSDPNLLGWWKLDETSGTFVMDSSGNDNHGAVVGDPQWVLGYDGGALELDGTENYAEIPHDETLTVDSEVAAMAWINARSLTGADGATYQGIVAKGNAVRSYSLYLQAAGTLHFSTTSAGAYVGSTSSGTVTANEWTHVCAMVADGAHQYFINGEPAGTGGSGIVLPGATDPAPVRIGNTQEGARFLSGTIDDVRVYGAALTQEQIQEAMRGDTTLAWDPQPSAGAVVDVDQAASLSWVAGDTAAEHDVYFGTDASAVSDADTSAPEYMGRQADTSYPLNGLVEFGGGDYFWRIDGVEADGVTILKGRVWMFTVPDYYIVDDFESYTDDMEAEQAVFQTWIDGWTDGTNGSVVGYLESANGTFGETTIVHGGNQSMPFDYNNINSPWFSETYRQFSPVQDWTLNGVTNLVIWYRGAPLRFVETADGITMSAGGTDIWDTVDQFRFAHKRLNGNGSIVAKVDSLVDTNPWAKVGVMIRESLEPGSKFAAVYATPGNGVRYQGRLFTNDNAVSDTDVATPEQIALQAPVWVKVERAGNVFNGFYSTDGAAWTAMAWNPQTISMAGNIFIGLAVNSHDASEATTAEFSGVAATGAVGQWQVSDIGVVHPGNSPGDLYAVVEDATGKKATVVNPDPAAVNVTDWAEWTIPLSEFTGVNVARVKVITVGVGDPVNPTPDGAGRLFIDDIRVTRP